MKASSSHLPASPFFFFLFLILALNPSEIPAQTYKLLWEVKADPAARPSYVFGTMHVTDENMFRLPDSVPIAIENTEGFATEVAFDEALNQAIDLFLNADKVAEQRGSGDFRAKLLEMLGGDGEGTADPMKLFENFSEPYEAGEDRETFLDAFLYRIAREQGKVVGGLENLEEQIKLLLSNQDAMAGAGGGKSAETILKNAYVKGDLDAIQAYMESAEVSDFFREEVLIRRNYTMARVSDSLMQVRPTFVAVGAGHLPGDEGLIQLLKQRGYAVRPVAHTYTGRIETYLNQAYTPHWTTYDNKALGIKVDVPVKPFSVEIIEDQLDMQFGMDLPGGFFYAFYRMRLPMSLNPEMREGMMEQIVSAMTSEVGDLERSPLTKGKFIGEEFMGQTKDYFFRTRILFDEESLTFLLVGITEKTARGPAADHFFNSVDTYEPASLFAQDWQPRAQKLGAFQASFPKTPEHIFVHNLPDDDSLRPLYMHIYQAEDQYHGQSALVRSMVLPPLSYIEDDSNYFAVTLEELSDSPEGEGDFEIRRVGRNGLPGLESSYSSDGDSVILRQVRQGKRFFLMMIAAPESEELGDHADSFFDSFSLLPLEKPPMKAQFEAEHFSALLPSQPAQMEGGWETIILPGTDAIFHYESTDTFSASVFTISEYHLSPYFRVAVLDSFLSNYNPDMDLVQVPSSSTDPQRVYTGSIQSEDEGEGRLYRKLVLTGDHMWIADFTPPRGLEAEKELAEEFFQGLAFHSKLPFDRLLKAKGQLILEHLDSPVDSLKKRASDALWEYKATAEELPLFRKVLVERKEYPTELRGNLVDLLLNSDAKEDLDQVIAVYNSTSDEELKASIISSLVYVNDSAKVDLAMDLLAKGFPKSENFGAFEDLLLDLYFADSLYMLRPGMVPAMLENPYVSYEMSWSFMDQLRQDELPLIESNQILDQSLTRLGTALEKGPEGIFKGEAADLLELTAIQFLKTIPMLGWTPLREEFARKVLENGEGEAPAKAAAALVEAGKTVSKDKLEFLVRQEVGGYDLLASLIGTGQTRLVSKKNFKRENIGRLALFDHVYNARWMYGFDGELSRVEFLEEEEMWWEGEDALFLIYRCAFKDASEWRLGICGPFPKAKGALPDDFDLRQVGSKGYHPNRYAEHLDELIEEARENAGF